MEQALELLRSKDSKERMAGIERLVSLLESSRKPLSSDVDSLVKICLDLLKDSNVKVSQGVLQSLASVAVLSGEQLKLHLNGILPLAVDKLGDNKLPVRDASRHLLLTLMEVASPTIIVERAGSYAWTHRNWRVREEFAKSVTSAIAVFGSTEPTLQRAILPPILQMLNDSNPSVREAAMLCIEEMYTHFGPQFCEEFQRQELPAFMVKDINNRLEKIDSQGGNSNGLVSHTAIGEMKPASMHIKKNSPRTKKSLLDMSLPGGEIDLTEKSIDPVNIYSEKELVREIEKIASTLVPEKDWSVRITAMQRAEALVIGGAAEYPSFPTLLKQLVTPLTTQLSDRRSSIVKQACHLLCFLSKELLGDFEACAEIFIPVLFKLVVITVLVIAESADNCIKTMLQNCKVSRILPRMADCAKNDHNTVLRARCCDYLLMMLEDWADAPEIQQSAELYEDFIKCCVADATSEVRSTARQCYKMFAKTWPERSKRLFLSFDPVIQRVINDEDDGAHKRHATASVRYGDMHELRTASQTHVVKRLPGMDKGSTALPLATDLNLESMLNASNQKVTAIESMLNGLAISEKRSFSDQYTSAINLALTSSLTRNKTSEKLEGAKEENTDLRAGKRTIISHTNREYLETQHKDAGFKDFESNKIPHFQRPLVRKHASGRVTANTRNAFEDNQILLGEMPNYTNGPSSLLDALTEGLSPSSDWFARVSAFNYLRNSLQQDLKGSQEVMQNFERVMKLFFHHLDDPHHKVAHAALSALAEIIPTYRKLFEGYLDRTLYHVFSRLIDPKESVRQLAVTTLEVVSKTYSIDSLLPALLRSLDEQRSPKVKLAVIEYAINSFNKNTMNTEGCSNYGILKLWLAKLTALVYDKNTKLKEIAISCILSIYHQYDSNSVVNFMLSMTVEEQNSLRRALKQRSPRFELDLMNVSQSKRERQRTADVKMSFDDGINGAVKKMHLYGRHSSSSFDSDDGKKLSSSTEEETQVEARERTYHNLKNDNRSEHRKMLEQYLPSRCVDVNQSTTSSCAETATGGPVDAQEPFIDDTNHDGEKYIMAKISTLKEISIPLILHQISNHSGSFEARKQGLQQLIGASTADDHSIWSKFFNQILRAVLETLDDSNSSVREVSLLLVIEMLKKQKESMEDSIEVLLEKFIHLIDDPVAKVSNEAEQCLSIVLSEYDQYKSLSVIVPLLITEDGKTLVTCIKCLTKLVNRLTEAELLVQLPSFLPALVDAFGSQSADIRKTVVFCLVDMYIKLGKPFLPYLEGLNRTQFRLVALYANRIAEARMGAAMNAVQG
ncbi:hypothetical protein ACFE04_025471 [Oxalis oulophora]